jgi:integrase
LVAKPLKPDTYRAGAFIVSNTGNTKAKTKSPKPPYKDFPLWWHPRGGWSKKIVGKVHYFGKDAKAAEAEYNAVRDDLQAGREPRAWTAEGITVADLFNRFLERKRDEADSGNLAESTFKDYRDILAVALASIGRKTIAGNLRPTDFRKIRKALGKGISAGTLKKRVISTRSPFKWGLRHGLLTDQPLFGDEFSVPKELKIANERYATKQQHGEKVYSAAEVNRLLEGANPELAAMILLGINCAMINVDIADLPKNAIDLDAGTLDWFRKKTGTVRKCILWPETVKALKAARIRRPKPKSTECEGLFFVTSHGLKYVRFQPMKKPGDVSYKVRTDAVGTMFQRLLKKLKLEQRGRGFAALRHTFRTEADAMAERDQTAIDTIMGHRTANIGLKHYVHRISDDRLRAVTDHVRTWLFGDDGESK